MVVTTHFLEQIAPSLYETSSMNMQPPDIGFGGSCQAWHRRSVGKSNEFDGSSGRLCYSCTSALHTQTSKPF